VILVLARPMSHPIKTCYHLLGVIKAAGILLSLFY